MNGPFCVMIRAVYRYEGTVGRLIGEAGGDAGWWALERFLGGESLGTRPWGSRSIRWPGGCQVR
jgi:hypothetical protein